MNITLNKIKRILVVIILTAVVVNLIINYVNQYMSSSESNIQKLTADINFMDKEQNKIQSEVTDIEVNKINEDAINIIYLMYGANIIDENQLLKELGSGINRAKKVYEVAKEKCNECRDQVRETMLFVKLMLIEQWEKNKRDAEQRINKAKEYGRTAELALRQEYLEQGVKWFSAKHSCLDVKQEENSKFK